MKRSQVLDAMSQLKLHGMKAAYDEDPRRRREATARPSKDDR